MAGEQAVEFVNTKEWVRSNLNQTHRPLSKMDFMRETPANGSTMDMDLLPTHLESTILPILYCFLCAFGLAGNVLVIYVVSNFSKMRTVANVYLLNLAVADILFLLVLPFMATNLILAAWPFGDFMCRATVLATNVNGFASFFSLVVLSVDRYYATVQPLRSLQRRTVSRARWVSVGVWSIALVLVCPFIVFARTIIDDNGAEQCILDWPGTAADPRFGARASVTYSFVLGFVVPFLFIAVCYTLIIFRLRTKGPMPPNGVSTRSRKKITVMVCAVVLAFVACWLPYHVFHIVRISAELEPTLAVKKTALVVNLLAFCNSAINPLIYHCLGENFRKGFRRLCPPYSSDSDRKAARRNLQTSLSSTSRRQVLDTDLTSLGFSLFQSPLSKLPYSSRATFGDDRNSYEMSVIKRGKGVRWSPEPEMKATGFSKENPIREFAVVKNSKDRQVELSSTGQMTVTSELKERTANLKDQETLDLEVRRTHSPNTEDNDLGSKCCSARKKGLDLSFPRKSRRFNVASWKHAPDKTPGDSLAKLTKFKVVHYREQWV